MSADLIAVPSERIINRIFLIRGKKVMIDRDLAALYGVETRVLNQAVKRNIERFPKDFMFKLSVEEFKEWISQFVISNRQKKGLRKLPLAFTEHGILMLSSVLNSGKAIQVNIQIMRSFTKLREMLNTNKKLKCKIEQMEKNYDKKFAIVFEAIKRLMIEEENPKKIIGFKID